MKAKCFLLTLIFPIVVQIFLNNHIVELAALFFPKLLPLCGSTTWLQPSPYPKSLYLSLNMNEVERADFCKSMLGKEERKEKEDGLVPPKTRFHGEVGKEAFKTPPHIHGKFTFHLIFTSVFCNLWTIMEWAAPLPCHHCLSLEGRPGSEGFLRRCWCLRVTLLGLSDLALGILAQDKGNTDVKWHHNWKEKKKKGTLLGVHVQLLHALCNVTHAVATEESFKRFQIARSS